MSKNLKKVQAKTREIHCKNVFKNLDMTIFFYFKSLKKQYLFSISQKRGAAKLVQNKTNYKQCGQKWCFNTKVVFWDTSVVRKFWQWCFH